MSSAHSQLFGPEFLSCHCANHGRPMDLVPDVVRLFVETVERRAVPARILESERQARVNCVLLRCSFTAAVWQCNIEAGEPQLRPCSLCGLPTGSFCDGCEEHYPLCSICQGEGDDRCRLCKEKPPAWSPAWSNLGSTQGWDHDSDREQILACPHVAAPPTESRVWLVQGTDTDPGLWKRKPFSGGRSSIVPASFQHQHRPSIAPIVPASSQHRSSIVAACQHPCSSVPALCQHGVSIVPASFQHRSSTVPASLQHRSSIAPASLQPKQSSGIASEAKANQQQNKRGQAKPSSKTTGPKPTSIVHSCIVPASACFYRRSSIVLLAGHHTKIVPATITLP